MASSRTLQRRPLLAAFLFGLLLAVLTAPSRGSMGRRRAHLQRHHHQHEVTAAAAAGPHPQEKEEEERPRSDGTMRRLAKLTKRPTPSPTPCR